LLLVKKQKWLSEFCVKIYRVTSKIKVTVNTHIIFFGLSKFLKERETFFPDIPYMTDRGPGILTKINVTEQDINDIISCLDPQKASGPDDISHRMLIATKNTICRSLC
jgi:hypothetical protein